MFITCAGWSCTQPRLLVNHCRYAPRGKVQSSHKILLTIIDKFKGGPVGITTIATAVGEDAGTVEEVYEPFLIMEGFIKRTPRGRMVTELAYKHFGRNPYGGNIMEPNLFDS